MVISNGGDRKTARKQSDNWVILAEGQWKCKRMTMMALSSSIERVKAEGSSTMVAAEKSWATTEVCKGLGMATAVVEVEQVQCECCGLAEECTPTYIAHVRALHCGRWVCGLCAEAVKEERGRAARLERLDEGLEDALRAHMNFCMDFNNSERTSPVMHLAAAMRRLLRRSLDVGGSDSSGSRSTPSSPRRSALPRSSSCMATLPRECRTSL